MTDIVERLREAVPSGSDYDDQMMREAADEIERLRAEFELFREAPSKLEVAQYEIERLRHEAANEIERLQAALDKIIGVTLGCRDSDLPAAKVHKIAHDALAGGAK